MHASYVFAAANRSEEYRWRLMEEYRENVRSCDWIYEEISDGGNLVEVLKIHTGKIKRNITGHKTASRRSHLRSIDDQSNIKPDPNIGVHKWRDH